MPVPPEKSEFVLRVGQWLMWMEHNQGSSASTVRAYELHLLRLCDWYLEQAADPTSGFGRDPLRASSKQLEMYTGMHAHQIGITPRSRRPIVAAVRGFYRWAAKDGIIEVDPATLVPYPHAGRKLPRSPSLAEAERLLMQPDIETFRGLRDTAMFALLMGCGLRISGLVGLNEGSLLWSQSAVGEQLALRVIEKGKKERIVPAPREAAMLVRAYLGHADLQAIDRSIASGDSILFVSTRNYGCAVHEYHGERRRLSARTVRQALARYARRAGIAQDSRHPHALRHLFGTELTESDVPTLQAQALMGHENAKDTQIYTLVAQRKLREVVDRANPLAKMQGPLVRTLRAVDRAANNGTHAPSAPPNGAYNGESRGHPKPRNRSGKAPV